jgi:hypothetical protein
MKTCFLTKNIQRGHLKKIYEVSKTKKSIILADALFFSPFINVRISDFMPEIV